MTWWQTEPTRVISGVLTVVLLCLPHLPAFGVPITPEQTDALNEILPALLVLLGGEVIRRRVTPVK